jgi:hypothetical protein
VHVWDASDPQGTTRAPGRPDEAVVQGRAGAAAARQADQGHRGGHG